MKKSKPIFAWLSQYVVRIIAAAAALVLIRIATSQFSNVLAWLTRNHTYSGWSVLIACFIFAASFPLMLWIGKKTEKRHMAKWSALPMTDKKLNIEWHIVEPLRHWVETPFSRLSPQYIQNLATGPYHSTAGCKEALVIPPNSDVEGPVYCIKCSSDVFSFRDREMDLSQMKVSALEEVQRLYRGGMKLKRHISLESPGYHFHVIPFKERKGAKVDLD